MSKNNWYHVFPVNDLEPHDLESFDCKCNPTIDWNEMMVIHNAFDKRDELEAISMEAFGETEL